MPDDTRGEKDRPPHANGNAKPITQPTATPTEIVSAEDEWEAGEESIADVLNTPAVKAAIRVFQESARQQADIARRGQDLAHEERMAQLAAHKDVADRRFDIEQSSRLWFRWVATALLVCIVVLFAYYRETPDVATKVGGYIFSVLGALGVGYSARHRRL